MAPCSLQGFGTAARGIAKGQATSPLPAGAPPASLRLLSGTNCAFAEGSSPGLAAAAPVVLLCGCTLAGSGRA